MLQKLKRVATLLMRPAATHWPSTAFSNASTSIFAKFTSLMAKPDEISYTMFCQDATAFWRRWETVVTVNEFVERSWSSLPWRTKLRYKSYCDRDSLLLLECHLRALDKLKEYDQLVLLPKQRYAKTQRTEVLKLLPRKASSSKSGTDVSSANAWLALDSTQRLEHSWYAYRAAKNLYRETFDWLYPRKRDRVLYRVVRATLKDEIKLAKKLQRPVGSHRGDRKPSERSDSSLRQFELDLAAWESKMAAAGLGHAAKKLQNIEQHQLLARLILKRLLVATAAPFAPLTPLIVGFIVMVILIKSA